MSPSENTTSTLVLDNSDPFLASPENNDLSSSVANPPANSTPAITAASSLSISTLESGSVIPASVMEFFPIKYQRQNKNDNTNPIPDNQSLQLLLKDTLSGSCRQSSLVNLLQLTEPLPPIIEGQGCEATTASASGCYDCSNVTATNTGSCCVDSTKVFSYPTAQFGWPVSFDSPKLSKRASMDHDMGTYFNNNNNNNSNKFFTTTGGVSPASLANINPLASAGLTTALVQKPMPLMYGSIDPTFRWTPTTVSPTTITTVTAMDGDLSSTNINNNNNNNNNNHDGCTECQLEQQQQQSTHDPQALQLSIVPRTTDYLALAPTQPLALPSTVTTRSLMSAASKKSGSNGGSSKKDDKEYIDLTPFLNMPQSEAARRLGIPTSSLSKKWKEAAFDRKWPYRTVCKIDKEIMGLLHNTSNPLPPDVDQNLGMLVRKRQEELRPVVIRK